MLSENTNNDFIFLQPSFPKNNLKYMVMFGQGTNSRILILEVSLNSTYNRHKILQGKIRIEKQGDEKN